MMIYPATHYTMGGIWVDYNLMTTIPGCYAIGEANFSDHGANRLGASALMQGLADGYFVLPYTIGDYLSADIRTGKIPTNIPEFDEAERIVKERLAHFINNKGTHSVDYFHKKLGKVMWDKVGMARNAEGLKQAIQEIREIREEFWRDVKVPGELTRIVGIYNFCRIPCVLPSGNISIIHIVTKCFSLRSLILFTEVPSTGFVTFKSIFGK